ncbi:MAG: glutathione S-transferase family protein [Mangrovicoccus sp.]
MGRLIDGVWEDVWYNTEENQGRFQRSEAQMRNWVTADGSAGPSGDAGFKAEPGRYHLYVAYACPWAHRTLIFRALKGLEDLISVSFVHWYMAEKGWTFHDDGEGIVKDDLFGLDYLHQLYTKDEPSYSGRVTVPVLWDKQQNTIVSNESSEIIRMFNSAFDGVGAAQGDYYPEALRAEIDELNTRIYDRVNNGVYKAGFATSQEAYDEAVNPLFDSLDWLEERLSTRRYLMGDQVTEADWRLFTTLMRFDPVYHGHFKCDRKRLVDYPNLWAYTRELYQWPGVAGTVNFNHTRRHYYQSHDTINPHRILTTGPVLDFTAPHNRDQL